MRNGRLALSWLTRQSLSSSQLYGVFPQFDIPLQSSLTVLFRCVRCCGEDVKRQQRTRWSIMTVDPVIVPNCQNGCPAGGQQPLDM